jgi:hypothetical protein
MGNCFDFKKYDELLKVCSASSFKADFDLVTEKEILLPIIIYVLLGIFAYTIALFLRNILILYFIFICMCSFFLFPAFLLRSLINERGKIIKKHFDDIYKSKTEWHMMLIYFSTEKNINRNIFGDTFKNIYFWILSQAGSQILIFPISVVLQPIKMRSSKPSHKHMTYCVTTLV